MAFCSLGLEFTLAREILIILRKIFLLTMQSLRKLKLHWWPWQGSDQNLPSHFQDLNLFISLVRNREHQWKLISENIRGFENLTNILDFNEFLYFNILEFCRVFFFNLINAAEILHGTTWQFSLCNKLLLPFKINVTVQNLKQRANNIGSFTYKQKLKTKEKQLA